MGAKESFSCPIKKEIKILSECPCSSCMYNIEHLKSRCSAKLFPIINTPVSESYLKVMFKDEAEEKILKNKQVLTKRIQKAFTIYKYIEKYKDDSTSFLPKSVVKIDSYLLKLKFFNWNLNKLKLLFNKDQLSDFLNKPITDKDLSDFLDLNKKDFLELKSILFNNRKEK